MSVKLKTFIFQVDFLLSFSSTQEVSIFVEILLVFWISLNFIIFVSSVKSSFHIFSNTKFLHFGLNSISGVM